MSLKAVHLVFVTLLTAFALGCGVWKLRSYFSESGSAPDLVWGILSLLAAAAVVVYGRYFLKKLKSFSYL